MVRSTHSKNAPAKGMSPKHKAALWLLAAFTAVQLWFHARVGRPGLEEEDLVECLGPAAATPQCFEARTFTLWRAQHPAEEHWEADAENEQAATDHLDSPVRPHVLEALRAVTSVAKDEAAQAQELRPEAKDEAARAFTVRMPRAPAAPEASSAEPEAAERHQSFPKFDEAYDALMNTEPWKSYSNASGEEDSTWARELVELQGRLESRMKDLKLQQREAKPREAPHHTDIHAWTRDLDILESHLKERGDELLKRRHARSRGREERAEQPAQVLADEAPDALAEANVSDSSLLEANASEASPVRAEPVSAWAQGLEKLQAELEAENEETKKRQEARRAQMHSHHSQPTTTAGLEQRIWDYGRELCSDPARADYAACAQFRTRHVANDVSEGSGATTAAPVRAGRHHPQVRWSDVKEWAKLPPALRTRGTVATVSRREARHVDWAGALPRVACVAVVPRGKDIAHDLRYFVDNFALQNYEGQKQLVIVANSDDKAARRALAKYSDHESIKAVFSQGWDSQNWDASVAYRFGAWSAKDADIIARWDFDAWHHPSRLALQVHSLVLARRPASHLRTWTTRHYSAEGATEMPHNETLGEPSLVGEREWMSQHWYPTTEVERRGFAEGHGRSFVELEDADLLVFQASDADLLAWR